MKKSIVIVGALFLSIFLSSPAAFPWGWAVHTYIDEEFATKWHLRNANQLSGGLAPDLFNFRFDAPAYKDYLFEKTHYDFMRVWDMAKSQPAKAFAFGSVSHNEAWGIDSTAHRNGLTFGQIGTIPEHPNEGGYVVAKAYILMGILKQIPQFAVLQLPDPVVLTVAHELVERGVDLLIMKKLDPTIGAKMAAAALPPNPNFPLLMERAYADELTARFPISHKDAVTFLTSSERQFRQIMVLYGQALMQELDDAVLTMADQLAGMAAAFLAAYGLSLPDDHFLVPLLDAGIRQAMTLCDGDFEGEVAATAEFVEQQLRAHGISY